MTHLAACVEGSTVCEFDESLTIFERARYIGLKFVNVLNLSMKILLATLFAVAGVVVSVGLAAASTSIPLTSLGYDIGFPQCSSNLPASEGFAVVGVNDGHPFSTNPCLVQELQWATTTVTGRPEFYANTANPGPANNSSWPTSQQTPQICYGANSVACSYDYGWNAAQGSFQNAVAAETQLGSPSPSTAAAGARWWLDVESGNAWETIRTNSAPTSASFENDQGVIQGELAYFASIGVVSVGVYSTGSQWTGLIGATGSTFSTTSVWMPGAATLAAAQTECASASFTGGRVAMIQYPSNGLDGDYQCALLVSPTSSSVSVTNSATFTDQLAVTGESAPVTYVQATGAPYLSVSSSGLIATSGALVPGTYTATGTLGSSGGSGTFTFTLLVGTMTQNLPTSASVSIAATANFTDQLATTGGSGAVTFVQTTGAPTLIVSTTGLVTTSGALASGSYVVRGTMSDAAGDKGTFFFNLKVGTITQSSLERATATAQTSATFTDQLATTGGSGAVNFVQTTGAPALVVSPTGRVTTSGALASGSYVARGTTSDAAGDKGTFFFNLQVGAASTITQSSLVRATASAQTSATFTDQLATIGGSGTVTFVQTTGAPALVVSPTGLVTTSGALVTGSYVARGTTSDAAGDKGTFFFNLRVSASAPAPTPTPTPILPIAYRVIGHAVAGRTVTLRITGLGFFGRPLVLSHTGTSAIVTRDSGKMLTLRVTVKPRSRHGIFAFVITLSNGKLCSVRYVQR